jgi:hypothetical protein
VCGWLDVQSDRCPDGRGISNANGCTEEVLAGRRADGGPGGQIERAFVDARFGMSFVSCLWRRLFGDACL